MARLPSRRSLVEKINQLEADIKPLAAAAGLGYVAGRLVPVATVARGATALSPIGAAALAADLAIRQEESLAYRGGEAAAPVVRGAIERLEEIERMQDPRTFGPGGALAFAPAVPVQALPKRAKKKPSQFNAAVKKGMATVKASTSYGKKGVINAPRKAFSAVTKTVSKVKKGKKAPTKGILGKVAREARKRFRRSLFRRRRR